MCRLPAIVECIDIQCAQCVSERKKKTISQNENEQKKNKKREIELIKL